MTEFKQTIGRGTRIHEETGKLYFTILDFRKVTEKFADPAFDGDPVVVYAPGPDDPIVRPDDDDDDDPGEEIDIVIPNPDPVDVPPGPDPDGPTDAPKKYVVGDVTVSVVAERVQYYGKNGQLITESLRDFTTQAVRKEYRSLDQFLRAWSESERKQVILDELLEQGVILEALEDQVGRDLDPFDLICHVVFGQPPLTRKERVAEVRKRDVFTKYAEPARQVLEALLDKYADQGIVPVEKAAVLRVQPFSEMGTPTELIGHFGDRDAYREALRDLEAELYRVDRGAA
jgi:type I restriction enzyme R subunit